MLFASNFESPNSDTQASAMSRKVLPSSRNALPRASAAWSCAFGTRRLSLPSPSISYPKGRRAAVEQASRRAVALHVPNALADPIALLLGDGRQDRENQFADAVARSTPIARKRMAGVGSWHAIGGEGRQAMSAVAHTTDSSRTSRHVRE